MRTKIARVVMDLTNNILGLSDGKGSFLKLVVCTDNKNLTAGGEVIGMVGYQCDTFKDIPVISKPAMIYVATDETNGGASTMYFHNGSTLSWLPSVGV